MSELWGHGQRTEYCAVEAQELDGGAEIVLETLDVLLYDTTGVRNDHFGVRDRIVDAYSVRLEWRGVTSGTAQQDYTRVFTIDRYASGIQACVEQPVVVIDEAGTVGEGREQAYMVEYDFEQLFDVLAAFNQRHDRERTIAEKLSSTNEGGI